MVVPRLTGKDTFVPDTAVEIGVLLSGLFFVTAVAFPEIKPEVVQLTKEGHVDEPSGMVHEVALISPEGGGITSGGTHLIVGL